MSPAVAEAVTRVVTIWVHDVWGTLTPTELDLEARVQRKARRLAERPDTELKFSGQNHNLTIQFLPWAPYNRTFTGLTAMGQALPTVMAPGSFALTALGGGTMTLNAPILIRQTGAIIRNQTVGFSTLTLAFVPEPSAGLLLVAAGGALALFARQR